MPAAFNLRALMQLMRISAAKNMTAAIMTPTANHITHSTDGSNVYVGTGLRDHTNDPPPHSHDTVRNICGHDLANMICPIDSATRLSVL